MKIQWCMISSHIARGKHYRVYSQWLERKEPFLSFLFSVFSSRFSLLTFLFSLLSTLTTKKKGMIQQCMISSHIARGKHHQVRLLWHRERKDPFLLSLLAFLFSLNIPAEKKKEDDSAVYDKLSHRQRETSPSVFAVA
jgi:hypothetical protein